MQTLEMSNNFDISNFVKLANLVQIGAQRLPFMVPFVPTGIKTGVLTLP